MRLGKIKFELYYVVDLDNKEMIDLAKESLAEDLMNAFKYWDFYGNIEEEEDNSLTEDDIPSWMYELLDTSDEEKEEENGNIQNQQNL